LQFSALRPKTRTPSVRRCTFDDAESEVTSKNPHGLGSPGYRILGSPPLRAASRMALEASRSTRTKVHLVFAPDGGISQFSSGWGHYSVRCGQNCRSLGSASGSVPDAGTKQPEVEWSLQLKKRARRPRFPTHPVQNGVLPLEGRAPRSSTVKRGPPQETVFSGSCKFTGAEGDPPQFVSRSRRHCSVFTKPWKAEVYPRCLFSASER